MFYITNDAEKKQTYGKIPICLSFIFTVLKCNHIYLRLIKDINCFTESLFLSHEKFDSI
jgi:hypothetical protein